MPEYLSPGVYIEEVDAGPRPIAGVSTSTAGMVGVTQRGPTTGKPKLVTNFLEFQTLFGGFLPEPDPAIRDTWANNPAEGGRWWLFPLAVKGFFDNGGQRLYVKRVVSSGAEPASGTFGTGLVSQVTRDAAAGASTLELSHLIGFAGDDEITVFRGDSNTQIGAATAITRYDVTTGRVDLATPLAAAVKVSRGDYVEIGARSDETTTIELAAASPGTWSRGLQVQVAPMVGATLPVLPDPDEPPLLVTRLAADAPADATELQVAATAGLSDRTPPFRVLINNRPFDVTAVSQPADGRQTLTIADAPHPAWQTGLTVRTVRRANPDGAGPVLRVGGANRLYEDAVVQLDTGTALTTHRVESIAGDEVTFDPAAPADVYENHRLHLVEARLDNRFGDVTESFTNLRLGGDHPSSLSTALASRSQLVQGTVSGDITDLTQFPTPPTGTALALGGGTDGFDTIAVSDFVGTDGGSGRRTGIVALEDIDEVAICAVPGVWSGTVESALATHCEQLKDRFAILDPQDGLDIEGIQTFREPFDTRYAALYYPWLVANDPSTNQFVEVPPSGHLAGIYARTDNERGVHKAPANTVIRGIRLTDGLAQDVTKRQQDLLNPKGINALRFFPGLGQRVWGARTLSSDTQWKYINVRRLFLFLEESIDEGTQWVVFEPNDESLWALVRQTVTNFLTTVWRTGALAGTTADEAFFVTCDRSTMTDDDIANGRLICVIGVAPVFPAEFVIFRIQQKTREPQLV